MKIEKHSIGFVPLSERYGSEGRLFTIWFSINLSIVCLTVGTLGVLSGLGLSWTIVALVLGNAVGTVFMAAHSAQGPHLGIPQMIQSRAQFGVLGAAIPLLAVIVTYTLYIAADQVVVKATIQSLLPLSANQAMIVFGMVALLVAFIGYELIHRIGMALSVLSGFLFLATAVFLFLGPEGGAAPVPGHGFIFPVFMATVTQAAAWSLTFGPYVADYSRYLKPDVSTASTFWHTAMGNFLATAAIMSLGAYMAADFPQIAADPGVGIADLFGPLSLVARALIVMGVFQACVMNLYSAYMSASTIFSGFRNDSHLGKRAKFLVMAAAMAAATLVAILSQRDFHRYFGDMLAVMVYLLVPWSAINLADYYIVRKGSYSVADMFDLDGIYARFNKSTIAIYLVAILVEAPFVRLAVYTGPFARAIGADLAWLPGIVVPALLYCAVAALRAPDRSALPDRTWLLKP